MQPAERNLEMVAGDRYDHEITFESAPGVPLALNGTWRAQVRERKSSSTILATFAIDDSNEASGVLLLSLTKVQTAALPAICVWDLEDTDAEMTYLSGTIRVYGQVSR